MNTGIATLRKRWLVVAATAVLLAVAVTAGTLFAANERRQPEAGPLTQQSVIDTTALEPAADPPVAPPAPERVFAQPADDQVEIDLPPIVKVPPEYPNLDSNLNRLVGQAQTQPAEQQPNTTDSIGAGSASSGEPVLVTFYVEPERVADVREYLEDNGVFIRNVGEDYIEAHVPPALLPAASERPGVQRVDTVIPPEPQSSGNVVSQGVALHQADAWHSRGYRGAGVKVGVIDGGFEGLSQRQGDELPRNVTARCYFEEARAPSSSLADCEADGDHGTAVAETLIDVAPEVELYVANPVSPGDLRNAADWMAEQGVQVINMSLGWIVDGPGDGTSPSSGSPLKTIDAAVSGGITWVNSGGNRADSVWYGTFADPDNDGIHNFAPRDQGNTFRLHEGEKVWAFMRWDDSWNQSDCDLDLLLTKKVGNLNVLAVVDDIEQDGSEGSSPFAVIVTNEATASQAGIYALWILKHECADAPAWIQLTMWEPTFLEHYSPGHHIGNPAESRNPGMLAVGATHYWDTNAIASYSSRGPALDGRTKPDITGIACGQSTVVPPTVLSDGSTTCWFPGTSQAAPHVAGLAALVKQRFPDYRPIQLTHYLLQNAAERGPAGADNTWGHGFATLPNPSSAAPAPTMVGTIADVVLTLDQLSKVVDVSTYFSAADGDMLTYTAESSDDMIATATVSGSMLTIEGSMAGTATITVYALAGSGMSAAQTFDVMVTSGLMAPMNVRVNPVGSGLVIVDWNSVSNAAGYTIIAVNIANPDEARTKSVNNPDAASGQIGNLTIGAQYNIYVGSFDANLDFAIDFSEKKRVTVE